MTNPGTILALASRQIWLYVLTLAHYRRGVWSCCTAKRERNRGNLRDGSRSL
jgi:hypothetical protein